MVIVRQWVRLAVGAIVHGFQLPWGSIYSFVFLLIRSSRNEFVVFLFLFSFFFKHSEVIIVDDARKQSPTDKDVIVDLVGNGSYCALCPTDIVFAMVVDENNHVVVYWMSTMYVVLLSFILYYSTAFLYVIHLYFYYN